uniref:CUB domain-containing protein n=1 Tax=Caenorhabditis tropicalis TaxID=1561998 RepID=A0A1I7TR56_9PELO
MCTIIILFILLTYSNAFQDGTRFSTPNYPKPYTGHLYQRQTISVNQSQGVAVVFDQFLASAHDCVIACPTNDDACSSLCGDAMDHGLVPKILRVPGETTLTIVSVEPNDGFPHSGISGKAIPYDLNKISFFECNDQVDLSSGDTYYLISQNYPLSPSTAFSKCSIKFSTSGSRQGIRFAVYDFYLSQLDSFLITGTENVTITGFATEDEPVVFYFQNEADVMFSITHQDHSFIQKRFYILVQSYENSAIQNCANTGKFDVALGQTISFGTGQFGVDPYSNNLNCGYNYTRKAGQNSLFALAIQYETEKCCDTMSIDGLTSDQQIYQGFQYSSLYFTDSEQISFFFESDPLVGGTGLNASLEHIDCTCSPGLVLVKNSILTSPGYSNSISYCPDLFCTPKIEFQDDLYDLQLEFTDINLRSYSLNNDTDSLTFLDSYGHSVVQMKPGYIGFMKFWATVSPVTLEFVSKSLTAFPLNMIETIITEKVVFNDAFIFKDISNLNLSSSNTFEFVVNGRPGTQIFMYFFTKTTNQVFIDIFDGDSMDATRIDNKALYSNILENGESLSLSTSSNKAVIHIRGDPTFYQPGTDFQALVTDLGTSCGPMVYSLRQQKTSSGDISIQGTDCFKILHFADSSYSQSAYMNLKFSKAMPMQVFYGLNIDNLIAQNTNDSIPQDLFTNYLVLKYSTSETSTVSYSWDISSGLIARTMQPEETVILLSDDYSKSNTVQTIQQFSVQLVM